MQCIGAHKNSFLAAIWLECCASLQYFERARGTKDGFWSQVGLERANRTSTVPRFCLWKTEFVLCFRRELSITGAWKSLCKALEHIATAFWPLYGWSATFCYITFTEQWTQMGGFWNHVSMEGTKVPSTVPRFSHGKLGFVVCFRGRLAVGDGLKGNII